MANFEQTQWSVVLQAQEKSSETSRAALAQLLKVYWFPVYSFIRHKGYGREQAEDLTQGFFARFVEKRLVAKADPSRGRFRSFLLTAVTNYTTNEYRRHNAIKRGGNHSFVSLDFDRADALYSQVGTNEATPEQLFERNWAETVLANASHELREEYQAAGKEEAFEVLKHFLWQNELSPSYDEVCAKLGLASGAARTTVYRFRKRYGALVRAEVARTLSPTEDVDEEVRYLMQILAK